MTYCRLLLYFMHRKHVPTTKFQILQGNPKFKKTFISTGWVGVLLIYWPCYWFAYCVSCGCAEAGTKRDIETAFRGKTSWCIWGRNPWIVVNNAASELILRQCDVYWTLLFFFFFFFCNSALPNVRIYPLVCQWGYPNTYLQSFHRPCYY